MPRIERAIAAAKQGGFRRRPFGIRRGLPWPDPPDPTEIEPTGYAIAAKGAQYPSWITGRGGPAAGDVIESFPYAIEFLLREFLGKTTNDINEASFNTAHSDLSGWTIKGSIVAEGTAEDIIDNILAQCKSNLVIDEDGKYYITVYDASAAVTYTDIDFEKDSHFGDLKIMRTDPASLYNSVRVRYNRNPASGEFTKETFIECVKRYSGANADEAVDDSETVITVTDGTKFNTTDKSVFLMDNEVCTVSSISTNDLTVTRGAKGSTAASHDNGTNLFLLQTDSDDGDGTRDQNTTAPNDRETDAINSVHKYNINQELVVYADMIGQENGGDTTAINLRNHYFDYFSVPHYAVEFHSYLMVSDIQITDIIEFNSTVMDAWMKLGGESWSGKKFGVVNVSRFGEMDYLITCVEL